MKQIRRNVFETNSSSTHSLTMCTKTDWDKLNEKKAFLADEERVVSIDEVKEILKEDQKKYDQYKGVNFDTMSDDEIIAFIEDRDGGVDYWDVCTLDRLIDERSEYLEYYEETFKTPGGEEVIAFGFFGYDG